MMKFYIWFVDEETVAHTNTTESTRRQVKYTESLRPESRLNLVPSRIHVHEEM
jgi:hypothetical protein